MKTLTRKYYIIILSVLAALVVFLFFTDRLANAAWRNLKNPKLAVLFILRDADLAMEIGNFYFGVGDYDLSLAERAYSRAVAARPKVLWGHYQLSRIHFLRREFDRALGEINKELEANPDNLRSLYVRGLIYGYNNNLPEAEADLKTFVRWAPKEWAGYNDLAWILSKSGKYAEAKDTINMAWREVAGTQENPWLWNSLGVAELNLKEYPRAAASFAKAKTFAEKLAPAEWQRAYPGNNPKDVQSSITEFQKAIQGNIQRAKSKSL